MEFAGSNKSPTIDQKSIKNCFQVELAMKCDPRRPPDVSRRPQDVPKRPQDSQDNPKMVPRRAQDAPRRLPGRPKTSPRSGKFRAQLADHLQTSILERLGVDFGRFWHRFWGWRRGFFRDFLKRTAPPVPCRVRFKRPGSLVPPTCQSQSLVVLCGHQTFETNSPVL